MKSIIHVNQHHIKHNAKNPDKRKPVLTVKRGKQNYYADEVKFSAGASVVYRPDKPLSCGAKVWIETDGAVLFPCGVTTYKELQERDNVD